MIDINLWRCRIGHFCVSVARSHKVRKVSQVSGSEAVSTTGVLTFFYVVLSACLLGNSLRSLATSVVSDDTSPPLGLSAGHTPGATTSSANTVCYDSACVVHVLPVHSQALVTLCLIYASWSLRRLLLSHDVETNPGPLQRDGSVTEDDVQQTPAAHVESATQHITPDFAQQILQAIDRQSKQSSEENNLIRSDLSVIKSELKRVSEKCDEINERCNRLEQENTRLSEALSEITDDITALNTESAEQKEFTHKLAQQVDRLRNEHEKMNSEIDRLEEFSRRDNLRFYGIPMCSDRENYDQCASTVVSALNSVEGPKQWNVDDIVRAHRVGHGNPKPMIVKMRSWRDKLEILKNKEFRSQLEGQGVRVANDLTRRQAAMVAQAKRDGMSAYFDRGVMKIGPRRAPRSYAAAVRADHDVDTSSPPSSGRTADSTVPMAESSSNTTADRQSGQGHRVNTPVNHRRESPRHAPLKPTSVKQCSDVRGGKGGRGGVKTPSQGERGTVQGKGDGQSGRPAARGTGGSAGRGTQQSGLSSFLSRSGDTRRATSDSDSDRRSLRSGSTSNK